MNYGELKTYVRDVLHRDDLTNARMDTWAELATKRLERVVDMPENEFVETITMAADTDFPQLAKGNIKSNNLSVKSVTVGNHVLFQVSLELLQLMYDRNSGGEPGNYAIRNDLYIGPGGDGAQAIVAFKAGLGDLVNDSDTNTLLNLHPKVYTWAMLLEAATFSQDADLLAFASEGFDQEVLIARRAGDARRYGKAPQMVMG